MNLVDLVDNSLTDKNTTHSYLPIYEKLFSNKKYSAKNILEVGVAFGGGMKLWKDYFINAKIYGIDVCTKDQVIDEVKNSSRAQLHSETDAYNSDFFYNFSLLTKDSKFDIILDDGSHVLEDMKKFIKLYTQLLKEDGILVIEDIQNIEWLDILKNETPDGLKPYIEMYDLRHIKGRYDDIIFVINLHR